MHLIRMHELKKVQSTRPVVNHAQDLHQSVIRVPLMFLARENKSLLFWLSVLDKNSAMKIDYIYTYIFTPFLLFVLFHSLCTNNRKLSMKSNLTCKKKVPTNHKNSSTIPLNFFYTCTNKGHMKICYFLQNSQYKITIVQIFPNYTVNRTSMYILFWTFFPTYTLFKLHAY